MTNDSDLCVKVSADIWRHVVTRCSDPLRQLHWPAAKPLITVRAGCNSLMLLYSSGFIFNLKIERNPSLRFHSGSWEYVLPNVNNQNCLKNISNTSNRRCSFHDLLVSRFIYLGVWPESEGIPHSFKIKLTRGKTCPFLRCGGRTGKALCRCCGHALAHIVTGWTQTSRRLDTPYFPLIETWSVEA